MPNTQAYVLTCVASLVFSFTKSVRVRSTMTSRPVGADLDIGVCKYMALLTIVL